MEKGYSEKLKLYILVPTYNERENLPVLINSIEGLNLTYDWWILVIDDNSPDGTGKLADDLAKEGRKIKALHRTQKTGLGSAYSAGFKKALKEKANLIITMDADLSHNPVYIPDLLEAIKENDLVIGSRYVRGGKVLFPLHRQIISKSANLFAKLILRVKIKDLTAGFKCYRKEALEKIGFENFCSEGYTFQVESHFKAEKLGLKVKEVPIVFKDREKGKTKMSIKEIVNGAVNVLKIRNGATGKR